LDGDIKSLISKSSFVTLVRSFINFVSGDELVVGAANTLTLAISGTGVGFNKTTKPRLVVYSSDNISSVINAIASSALIPVQIIL
jgi:hypothetical protein